MWPIRGPVLRFFLIRAEYWGTRAGMAARGRLRGRAIRPGGAPGVTPGAGSLESLVGEIMGGWVGGWVGGGWRGHQGRHTNLQTEARFIDGHRRSEPSLRHASCHHDDQLFLISSFIVLRHDTHTCIAPELSSDNLEKTGMHHLLPSPHWTLQEAAVRPGWHASAGGGARSPEACNSASPWGVGRELRRVMV